MVEMKVQLSCQWQFPSGKRFRSLIPFLYTSLFRLDFRSHFLSRAKLQQVRDFTKEIQKIFIFKTTHSYFVYFVIDIYHIKGITKLKILLLSNKSYLFHGPNEMTNVAEMNEMWQWQIHFILSPSNYTFYRLIINFF